MVSKTSQPFYPEGSSTKYELNGRLELQSHSAQGGKENKSLALE
jgi:hypothetical protein